MRTLIAVFLDRVDEAAGVGLSPALQSARDKFEASIDPESIDALGVDAAGKVIAGQKRSRRGEMRRASCATSEWTP